MAEENKNMNQGAKKRKKEKKQKPILTETDIKIRKAKRTKLAVASFVLLLGIGAVGNWYYQNTDLSSNIQPLINSSQTKTLGEAEYVGATTEAQTENEYFSTARVDRQTARDEALEKLQKIVDSTDESDEARTKASEDIARLSSNISIENKIETLVTAKGVENCIAVVSEDGSRVDVIVDVSELSDTIIMQIKDIAMQQLGCSFENVSIIQSK